MGARILAVTLQWRVVTRSGRRFGVKAKSLHGLGVSWSRHGGIGTMRRWFLRGRGGGQGLPPPLAEAQPVHRGMGLPADASGAYRPNPQATTKLAPRPSSLKGYPKMLCSLARTYCNNQKRMNSFPGCIHWKSPYANSFIIGAGYVVIFSRL